MRFMRKDSSLFCWLMAMIIGVMMAPAAHAELMVGDVSLRATVGGMKATGGYVSIHNHGEHDDRLVGVTAAFAKKSEIHTMETVDGVMKMRPMANGLVIPAGEIMVLKPGGMHLMFMGLDEALAPGSMYQVILQFETAGDIRVKATAKRPGDIKVMMNHDDHDDHDEHTGHDDHSDHNH